MGKKKKSRISGGKKLVVDEYKKRCGYRDDIYITMVFAIIIIWSIFGLFCFIFLGLFGLPMLAVKINIDVNILMGYFKDCLVVFVPFITTFIGFLVGKGKRGRDSY